MGKAQPGDLGLAPGAMLAPAEVPATTHFSIVDHDGNALAMTSSIEGAFGSSILVEGFLLNNQLTDFSFAPTRDGAPVANRLEPGKRPLSSMAPTIVFDAAGDGKAGDKIYAVLGSPGGPHIINFVAQTLVALIDDHRAPDDALAAPHIGNRNGASEFEAGVPAATTEALAARGHDLRSLDVPSGTHLIVRAADGKRWLGAADPRREGVALGR